MKRSFVELAIFLLLFFAPNPHHLGRVFCICAIIQLRPAKRCFTRHYITHITHYSKSDEWREFCTPPCHQHQHEMRNNAVFYTHSHGRSTGFCEMYIIDGSWYEKKNFNVIKIVVGVEFKIKSAQRTVELSEREGETKWIKAWKLSHNKAHIYTAAIRRQGGHHVHSFTLLDLPLHGSPLEEEQKNEKRTGNCWWDLFFILLYFFCSIAMVTDNLQFVISQMLKYI